LGGCEISLEEGAVWSDDGWASGSPTWELTPKRRPEKSRSDRHELWLRSLLVRCYGVRSATTDIIILTPVRLLGDGLTACFDMRPEMTVRAVVSDLPGLRDSLKKTTVEVVLVDVTEGVDLYDVRSIAAEWPNATFVALGLNEQRQEVIKCGRAGFTGYFARDASIEALCRTLSEVVAGRLACPPEISGGLLRALCAKGSSSDEPAIDHCLTRRESQVLHLVAGGLSNKEIARELYLSVATVKHHVHHILEKLQIQRRTQAMRWVRGAPGMVVMPPQATMK